MPVHSRQVAYMWMPYFGTLVARGAGRLTGKRPLVLLDAQGRVLCADAGAAQAGVAAGMSERQAVARCPHARFDLAARYPIPEAQEALWTQIRRFTDCWQPDGLGNAYLDADGVGAGDTLLSWCQELAEVARQRGWEPALGATGSKFGASVAGRIAGKNTALLLVAPAQRAFLAPQPATLLPLDDDALLQLHHLGIRTLGQFAQLPASGVLARFGQAGRTAQRWAQGSDDRPIVSPWEAPEVSARLEFETPLADRERLHAALAQRAARLLASVRGQLQVVGSLRLIVTRADRRVVVASHTFPQPTAAEGPILQGILALLEKIAWEGQPAAEMNLILGDICDAPVRQLSLFDVGFLSGEEKGDTSRAILKATLEQLAARFGPDAFRMAVLNEPDHPLPERRSSWQRFDG